MIRSEAALIVGAPLVLAIVELFHPQPHELLQLNVSIWLGVHFAQIPLFPLAALAMALLIRARTDIAAKVSRVALFLFAVSFTAFDTAAGVVTGILVRYAQQSAEPAAWLPAINAIWTDPVVGGSPLSPSVLPILGSIALSIGAVAAAVSLRRAGHSWPPVLLLAIASFGISIFRTHAWPGGPLTFGGQALASAWLLQESPKLHR